MRYGKNKPLERDKIHAILRLGRQGLKPVEISRQTNTGVATVCEYLDRFGISRKRKQIGLSREAVQELYQGFSYGWRPCELAKQIPINYPVILYHYRAWRKQNA